MKVTRYKCRSHAVKWRVLITWSRRTPYSAASNMKLLPLLCLLSLWLGPASPQGVVTVAEDADAVLPCSSNGAVEEFDWKKDNGEDENNEVFLYKRGSHDEKLQDKQFKGRVDIFEDELKTGNASLKIHSTKLEDSGTYICVLGPLDKPSRQEFYIRLNVGAAPKPGVNKLDGTGVWSLLQCEAHGVPKPEVKWRDSSGNVLPPKEIKVTERDRRFYITSKLNVTKTDHYTCVVTQKEMLHQINNTIFEVFQDMIIVAEGADAVLPCSLSSKDNIEKVAFYWRKDDKEVFLYKDNRGEQGTQFKERVSYFENELKFGNASIRIKNTKMTDSGTYICHFPAKQKTHIRLHVVQLKENSVHPAAWIVPTALSIFFFLFLFVGSVLWAQGRLTLQPKRGRRPYEADTPPNLLDK